MTVAIYHNPDCGTSRNTLAMIRATGVEPVIIEYLKTPPSRAAMRELLCRPSETVLDLLDGELPAAFVKEDGTPAAPRAR